jgi:IS4 transposase
MSPQIPISDSLKALEQDLKIETFLGTSESALYIQIWTAMTNGTALSDSLVSKQEAARQTTRKHCSVQQFLSFFPF